MPRNLPKTYCKLFRVVWTKSIVWKPRGSTRLLFDKVFFSPDYLSVGSRCPHPGGCGVVTLEHFEIFKMAAKIVTEYGILLKTLVWRFLHLSNGTKNNWYGTEVHQHTCSPIIFITGDPGNSKWLPKWSSKQKNSPISLRFSHTVLSITPNPMF